jgi:hypothetical protein
MMDHDQARDTRPWWRTRTGWTLLGFLAIAAFFFFTEHRAHVLGVLPFVLLLLCPLLHVFAHGRHGMGTGQRHDRGSESRRARS